MNISLDNDYSVGSRGPHREGYKTSVKRKENQNPLAFKRKIM